MSGDGESKKKLEKQAEEVGCWGLINGVASNVKTHKEFSASTAIRSDGPFYCKSCLSDAVLRKCAEKQDHFAHKARLSPVIPKGESERHRNCKETICRLLHDKFPQGNWATEREIPKNIERGTPKLRPDISGRINDLRVVIEVQVSDLTAEKMIARTESYAKCDISLLWVVPLTEELGTKPFRPRRYERYLHSIYFGRVYYWWNELEMSLMPVHFGVAKRHIEFVEWVEDGCLVSAGGYEKSYKTIKTPLFGPVLSIGDDFQKMRRRSFTPENERKRVPSCVIWIDKHKQWWKEEKSVVETDKSSKKVII
jgi:competence protein CoiA